MATQLTRYNHKYCYLLIAFLVAVCAVTRSYANSINQEIKAQENKLGARIGVSVFDVNNDDLWSYQGDTRFPLMSTFKVLACAKLLSDIERGLQSFENTTVINEDSLIEWSPITKNKVGEYFSLKQACEATMIMSDNTAANIVLEAIEGPEGLTRFMRNIGDNVTRLDRIEPELNEAKNGDVRDTTTPNAMVKSLHTLLFGEQLSKQSKAQLKQWMIDNKLTESLLRSVLPDGWSIADRSGAGGYGSRGINAVVWSEERSPLIVSIYLTQTDASFAKRNQAIAAIGKAIFNVYNKE